MQAQEYEATAPKDLDRYCYDDAGNRTQHYSDIAGSAPQCPEPTTEGSVEPMAEDPQPASAPPPNNAPNPSPDYVSGMCATTSTIDMLVNDVDVDGDPLQLVSLTPDGTGPATANSGTDGLAAINFGASDGLSAFIYIVADDRGGEATGRLTVETSGC
ncbi:Ig-like domain-containing protein [Qipengyuania sp. DSG2-2]|uniref:Ig-like domain-containing protein n=1 Tax=Qipengyuania sp. DGS2-2 TaxID=3349631 RepID=UPI0036D2AA5C